MCIWIKQLLSAALRPGLLYLGTPRGWRDFIPRDERRLHLEALFPSGCKCWVTSELDIVEVYRERREQSTLLSISIESRTWHSRTGGHELKGAIYFSLWFKNGCMLMLYRVDAWLNFPGQLTKRWSFAGEFLSLCH